MKKFLSLFLFCILAQCFAVSINFDDENLSPEVASATGASGKSSLDNAIQSFFKGIDPQKLLKVTFLDVEGNQGEKAKPVVTKVSNDSYSFSIGVLVQFDMEAYWKLVNPLMEALEKTPFTKSEYVLTPERFMNYGLIKNDSNGISFATQYYGMDFDETEPQAIYTLYLPSVFRNDLQQNQSLFFFTDKRPRKKQLGFNVFEIGQSEVLDLFSEKENARNGNQKIGGCQIRLILSDKDGNEIARDDLALNKTDSGCQYFICKTNFSSIVLCPFFVVAPRNDNFPRAGCMRDFIYIFNLEIDQEDVKDIADMKLIIFTDEK